jgi:hypothetical protein
MATSSQEITNSPIRICQEADPLLSVLSQPCPQHIFTIHKLPLHMPPSEISI